jgi:hypothetical protein
MNATSHIHLLTDEKATFMWKQWAILAFVSLVKSHLYTAQLAQPIMFIIIRGMNIELDSIHLIN